MRTLFVAVTITFFIAAPILFPAIQAADVQNGKFQRQQIESESACVLCGYNDGLPCTGTFYGSDGVYTKRLLCCRHPVTLAYHPEVYNYRYFFNIIGHDSYSNSSNHRFFLPSAPQPDEILTPVPEPENQLPQTAGSARLTRPDQKKFQK
ncbi:MAG: hypothetical protein ABSE63_12615 [Thermoguttaceae bacterium]|jgi:hypothetical protein